MRARHAEAIKSKKESDSAQVIYYMPHKEAILEDATTTKFRIVFDASTHLLMPKGAGR